jgi:hypothetical protein
MMQASLHIIKKTCQHTAQPTPHYSKNEEVARTNVQRKRLITSLLGPATTQYQRKIKSCIASVPLEWSNGHLQPTPTICSYLHNFTIKYEPIHTGCNTKNFLPKLKKKLNSVALVCK